MIFSCRQSTHTHTRTHLKDAFTIKLSVFMCTNTFICFYMFLLFFLVIDLGNRMKKSIILIDTLVLKRSPLTEKNMNFIVGFICKPIILFLRRRAIVHACAHRHRHYKHQTKHISIHACQHRCHFYILDFVEYL